MTDLETKDAQAKDAQARAAVMAAWAMLPVEQRSARPQAVAFAQHRARLSPFAGSAAQVLQILGWLLPTLPRASQASSLASEANQPA